MALNALLPIAAQARPIATVFNASICGGGESHTGDKLDHCRLCLAGGDRAPVLPAVGFVFHALPLAFAAQAVVSTPSLSSANLPANSRGPPASL